MSQTTFRAADVLRIFRKDKVTQRKLDYWDQQGVLCPTGSRSGRAPGAKASGRGDQRLYTYTDLVRLRVLVELRRAGLSLQKIRQGLRRIRRREPNMELLLETLYTDGKDFYVRRRDGSFEDLLSGGQLVFGIVALDNIERDVCLRIQRLKRTGNPTGARAAR